MRRPVLHINQILSWADAHKERVGRWPEAQSGRVWEDTQESWQNIDQALRVGLRGLRPKNSLAKLLGKHRGKRNRKQLPHLTDRQILGWADAHFARHGRWPKSHDQAVTGAPGETWLAVDLALRRGQRGHPGGTSLAQLLFTKRHARNRSSRKPALTVELILKWADSFYRRTGNWPTSESGPVREAPGEAWSSVDRALKRGARGLPKMSLAKLLAKHRGVARYVRKPRLSLALILKWADDHKARTGRWPKRTDGKIAAAPAETWSRITAALEQGKRGLPGGWTLAKLLAQKRSVRTRVALLPLDETIILAWARAYFRKHGRWPSRDSGSIPGSHGESWAGVNHALRHGRRGLRKTSLFQLLVKASRKPELSDT